MAGAGEDMPAGRPYRRPMTVWALGDYPRFAREMIWNFGPTLVTACGIGPGTTGARRGGRHRQRRHPRGRGGRRRRGLRPRAGAARSGSSRGSRGRLGQADAAALPFADGEFDVVTSAAGVIFAPDHQAAADELVRVCRPGGTIGPDHLHARGHGRRVLPDLRRGAADPLGRRRARPRPVRRPSRAQVHASDVRRARAGWAAGLRRLLQGNVRTGGRDLREPRRRPAARSSTATSWTSSGAGTPATATPSSRSSTC